MAASPQNALLKMLEEPPPSSVFILVTARPGHAAADGAVALPASAVSACPSQAAVDADARDVAWRVLERRRRSDEPRQRIEAAKDLLEGYRRRRTRSRGSGAARLAPARDGVAAARRRTAVHPGGSAEPGQSRTSSPSSTGSRRRIAASAAMTRLRGGRSGAGGARQQCQRQDRGRLARAAAVMSP